MGLQQDKQTPRTGLDLKLNYVSPGSALAALQECKKDGKIIRSVSAFPNNVTSSILKPNDKLNIAAVAIILSACVRADSTPSDFDESQFMANGRLKTEYRSDPVYLAHFMTHMFKYAELGSDCIVMTLIYMERFLAHKKYCITPYNVRPLVMTAMLLSAKVWDDRGIWNVDCYQMYPDLASLSTMNNWERLFLDIVDFQLTVSASLFAKYYFLLLMNHPRQPLLPETPRKSPQQILLEKLRSLKTNANNNNGGNSAVHKSTSLEEILPCRAFSAPNNATNSVPVPRGAGYVCSSRALQSVPSVSVKG
jgi:hypothetical protein